MKNVLACGGIILALGLVFYVLDSAVGREAAILLVAAVALLAWRIGR